MKEALPTTKADRLNELPGQEVGSEYALPSDTDADAVAQTIFNAFKRADGSYRIADSLITIGASDTRHIRYTTKDGEKLFVINIRERDGFITVKKKGRKVEKNGVLFREEQEEPFPADEWNDETERKIVAEEAARQGVSSDGIVRAEDTQKRKLKVRLMHYASGRIYSVGVSTKVRSDGTRDVSLSIDYVGKEPMNHPPAEAEHPEEEIVRNIRYLREYIGRIVEIGHEIPSHS